MRFIHFQVALAHTDCRGELIGIQFQCLEAVICGIIELASLKEGDGSLVPGFREERVFVDQFSEAIIADPVRMALAERVEVRHDPAITAKGREFRHSVRVEVWLKDGKKLEHTAEAARGTEQRFASDAQIVDKFEKLASHVLPAKQVSAIRDAVLGLDKLEGTSTLLRLLTGVS